MEFVHAVLNLVGRQAGEKDHRQRPAVLLHVSQHIKTIALGHVQVEQKQIDRFVFQVGQGGIAISDFIDNVISLTQELRQCVAFCLRIIAKQNFPSHPR